MDILKNGLIAAIVAIVVTIGTVTIFPRSLPAGVLVDAGAVAEQFGATSASFASTVFSHLSNLQVNGNFNVVGISGQGGDANTGVQLQTQETTGVCNTASSTAFAVVNPFTASSTASIVVTTGTQATSSLLQIGTSTATTGLTSSTVTGNLMQLTLATSSPAHYLKSGDTTDVIMTTSNGSITVGPTMSVSAFSTSTYSGVGAVNYVPTSCTYKIKWEN